jgi:hypothetical protein
MGRRYRLTYSDGEDPGEAEYPGAVQPGHEIRIEVTGGCGSVIPVELAGEFDDGAVYAVLEVEPL